MGKKKGNYAVVVFLFLSTTAISFHNLFCLILFSCLILFFGFLAVRNFCPGQTKEEGNGDKRKRRQQESFQESQLFSNLWNLLPFGHHMLVPQVKELSILG